MENIGDYSHLENIGTKKDEQNIGIIFRCILYFSIRATSPDESLVTEWKEITISALTSRQHTRLDFQLSSSINTPETSCQLSSVTEDPKLKQEELRTEPSSSPLPSPRSCCSGLGVAVGGGVSITGLVAYFTGRIMYLYF